MDEEKTIGEHLKELRKQVLLIFIPITLVFFLAFYLSEPIVNWLLTYYTFSNVVSLTPLESISTQIRVSLCISILLLLPLLFSALYKFVKPAIPLKILTGMRRDIIISYSLAVIGFVLGLLIFSKLILTMLLQTNIVETMWSIKSLMDFSISIAISLALVLQIIILLPILKRLGIDVNVLKKYRLPLFALIIIVSAIITPPDLISQLMLAIPIYGSFELGLLFSKIGGVKC